MDNSQIAYALPNGSITFYFNIHPHFIGQELEIYFYCPVDSYVSFIGYNGVAVADLFVAEDAFYKYTINFIPTAGTDLKALATLQQCAYIL